MSATPSGPPETLGQTVRALDVDSRARTHLANERTFLAWLRTGLSLIALGLAASEFLTVPTVNGFDMVRILAPLLVLGGMAMAVFGGTRFIDARDAIERGSYAPRSGAVVVTVGFSVLAGALVLLFVLASE